MRPNREAVASLGYSHVSYKIEKDCSYCVCLALMYLRNRYKCFQMDKENIIKTSVS